MLNNFPKEAKRHWDEFRWYKNSLFIDSEGKMPKKNMYSYIRVGRLGDIEFRKIRVGTFTFSTPTTWNWQGTKQQTAALRRWIWMAFINDPKIHAPQYDAKEREPLPILQLDRYRWSHQGKYIVAVPKQPERATEENFLIVDPREDVQPATIIDEGQDNQAQHFIKIVKSRPLYFETKTTTIPLLETKASQRKLI